MIPLSSVARLVRRRARRAGAGAACELCGAPIAEPHRHVVDRDDRRLLCACVACVVAFDGETPARFRAVPTEVRRIDDAALDHADLAALGVPVGLFFVVRSSRLGRSVAVFPSAAGPTESELDEDAVARLRARVPGLDERGAIADDVEALLVRRHRDGTGSCFVAPVDLCYELTGILRRHFRGFDGGDEVRRRIDAFFAELEGRSARTGGAA